MVSPATMPVTAHKAAYDSPFSTRTGARINRAESRIICSTICETAGIFVSCIPKKHPLMHEPADMKGIAKARVFKGSSARASFRTFTDKNPESIKSTKAEIMLIARHIVRDFRIMTRTFPKLRRALS